MTSIPEFYTGKTLFITGATGFIGKVLIEKLLRNCSNLSQIYILVRSKKGVDPEVRRLEFVNNMVSDLFILIITLKFKLSSITVLTTD